MRLDLHYVPFENENGMYFICDLRSTQNIRSLQVQPEQDIIFYSKISYLDELARNRLDFLIGLKEEKFPRIFQYSEEELYDLTKKIVLLTEREISPMKTLKLSLEYKTHKLMKELRLLQKMEKEYFNS